MSLWSRLTNVFRSDRLNQDLDEELKSHFDEAAARGRDPREVRRAFGSTLRHREASRDAKLFSWLDSLRSDTIFGWRQLRKKPVTSAAVIVSLALAIGACTSAFRLIDALLLRHLPVSGANRLYSVTFGSPSAVDSTISRYDSCSYPMFERMRSQLRDQADSVAISMYAGPMDLTYGSDQEMERANLQYVSGSMFEAFKLRPAAGRLLTAEDDSAPGAHPYAVISFDYWKRRFASDPGAVGRTFRIGNDLLEIVGVAPEAFTGTETGFPTAIFVPMAMKDPHTLASLNRFWLRALVLLRPGVSPGLLEQELRATFRSIQEERVKGFPAQSQRDRDRMFQESLSLEPAFSGRSNLQRDYREALSILGLLVALVLLIACANVANLMAAKAAARSREMALRISIGAGRWRLVQLVLVESAMLAIFAAALGCVFAWYSAPFVVSRINPIDRTANLALPFDGRVVLFCVALTFVVAIILGLSPAIRASSVRPVSALKDETRPSRRRFMFGLVGVQVALCFVVHLAAGLFVATFERLSNQPTGFSSERILNIESVTRSPQPPVFWQQVADHLRSVQGVEGTALIGWPLMSGESAVGNISVDGAPPSDVFSDYVTISPGWAELMRIPLLAGRDIRPSDSSPAAAIVNQSFAKQYFDGQNPVGRWFDRVEPSGGRSHTQIVGLIQDARSRDRLRSPIRPTVYIPFPSTTAAGEFKPVARGTFVIRTAGANPLAFANALRQEVARAGHGFRASDVRTQAELNLTDTLRERLLAILATFFAVVALLLSGVGLYGVLHYSVLHRRREIGIRIAVGAQAGGIVRLVTSDIAVTVCFGAIAGLAIGIFSARYVASLFYQVKATDISMLTLPWITILAAASLAALPAILRAIRIDPAKMLRAD